MGTSTPLDLLSATFILAFRYDLREGQARLTKVPGLREEETICKWYLSAEFPSVTRSHHFLLCSIPNS